MSNHACTCKVPVPNKEIGNTGEGWWYCATCHGQFQPNDTLAPNADQTGPKDRMAEGVANKRSAENNPKNLPLSAVSATPAPSSLEAEMSKVLITYDMKSQYDRAEGKTNLVTHSEALSQLKQLILKDKLKEFEALIKGQPAAFEVIRRLDNRIAELESARKRYQS
jgi:hypothetical protein